MRLLFLVLCVVLMSTNLLAQTSPFTGDWKGKISAFNLTLIFHITEGQDKLSATLDSPDQGAKGIPCDKVEISGNEITITLSVVGGSYKGRLSDDKTTIDGKWNQGGGSFDLVLGKGEMPAEKPKRQTPQPPFSYTVEDIEYDNADKSVHFGATLTYPSTGSKFPAVILISGSGQQDRDETLMGHKPFAILADRLTKLGMAVLRVDDRGMGKSTGEVKKATSADFAKDVITSIEYLKARKEVDDDRIGLLGHSEGGLIAALVAAERKDIDFMVLLAGPGIIGSEILAEQAELILLKSGVSPDAVTAYMPFYRNILSLVVEEEDSSAFRKSVRTAYDKWLSSAKPEHLEQLGMGNKDAQDAVFENLSTGFAEPWMRYFMRSDASLLLEKVSTKVLALNGEKDIQVIPTSNTKGIEKALKKSKTKVYDIKILPGLNHLFQRCDSCSLTEYGTLEESFSEEAILEISNWLKKNVLN